MINSTRQPPRKQPGQGRGVRVLNGAILSVGAAAETFFGGTEKMVRGLIARRLIPFRKLGGRIIFVRSELEEWVRGLEGCRLDEARQNLEVRHHDG